MAREEQDNGSGRQESSLSARRARLRSLARQALPPDPYAREEDDEPNPAETSFELEPMAKAEEAAPEPDESQAPETSPDPPANSWGPPPDPPQLDPQQNQPAQTTTQDPQPPVSPIQTQAEDISIQHDRAISAIAQDMTAETPHIEPAPPPPPDPPAPTIPVGLPDTTEPPPPPVPEPPVPEPPVPDPPVPEPSHEEPQAETPAAEPQKRPSIFDSIIQQHSRLPEIPRKEEESTTVDLEDSAVELETSTPAEQPEESKADSEPQADSKPESLPWDPQDSPAPESIPEETTETQSPQEEQLESVESPTEQAEAPAERDEDSDEEPKSKKTKRKRRTSQLRKGVSPESEEDKEPEEEEDKEPEEEPEAAPEQDPTADDSEAADEEIQEETPKTRSKSRGKGKRKSKKQKAQEEEEEQETNSEDFESDDPPGNELPELSKAAEVVREVVSAIPSEYLEDSKKNQAEAIELLNSIDQALGVCAMNLSALQQTAKTQTEAMSAFKDTLQNQTFLELGLELNTVMESMSAALEPMKAAGELVPSIDQLVSAMEAKVSEEKEETLSPDKLVSALADQLAQGLIDPWTFRCAYMAVYPDEHPADLLHRLVDLLGTQRLPGDLFRQAYEAIQATETPPEYAIKFPDGPVRETVKVVQDDELKKQVEELMHSNNELKELIDARDDELKKLMDNRDEELNKREEDITTRIEERESHYADKLAQKEKELQETQDTLQARFEEFNTRYDEMVEAVNQREEELKGKQKEIKSKDSEIVQLRAQLDELQEQFKDTVSDMQKQLAATKQAAESAVKQQPAAVKTPEEPKKPAESKPAASSKSASGSGGFFDTQETKSPLLDSGPARPLLQQQMDAFNKMSKPAPEAPAPAPTGAAPSAAPPTSPSANKISSSAPVTGPLSTEPSNQAVPRSSNQGPNLSQQGTGSYGNGVRAQVFEVIVRQALAGAPWREICAGPMQVNNISADEVEAEVQRRQALLKK